jgi:2-keto-4-pentenoate hydratase/2-oxohepta-3-ene-1,7-dioic acid hydratase in catechol pathway
VGLGFDPPQFLRAGDVVELGIDGLGFQKQLCRLGAWAAGLLTLPIR